MYIIHTHTSFFFHLEYIYTSSIYVIYAILTPANKRERKNKNKRRKLGFIINGLPDEGIAAITKLLLLWPPV